MKKHRERVKKLFGPLSSLSHSHVSGWWNVKSPIFYTNKIIYEIIGSGRTPETAIEDAIKNKEKDATQ